MYVVFLAGGIASGKSTVAGELERLGAWRIDLDQVSREVLEPGTQCLAEVADEFGQDLVDADTGVLDRAALARRAFASAEATARLEAIELPHITAVLVRALEGGCASGGPGVCVVEVPLLDRVEGMCDLADEVVAVCCPLELRRARAQGRGMDVADFDRRVAAQPTDDYLRAHATTVFDNTGSRSALLRAVYAWWTGHGWELPEQEG